MYPNELPSDESPVDVLAGIDIGKVPVHVACVMDGNGRWAQRAGLPRNKGHAAGEGALADVVRGALDVGVRWLTVYAFSTENWSRPQDEVDFLMTYYQDVVDERAQELHGEGIRILFTGRRTFPMPASLIEKIDSASALTKDNTEMTLVIALNYGSRAELVDAMRKLIEQGATADEIDEARIQSNLYLPEMPDVDLLIRTSNEHRISNFLLWQIAYAELYFTETLWPDFTKRHFFDAIREYQGRQRRFGGLSA